LGGGGGPPTKGVPAAAVATEKPAGTALQPNAATPMPPPPRQSGRSETFNVTVRDVPVADVLFVLARDAHLSLDISPRVVGQVTLIAIDQTLPQILSRIAEQVAMRYEFKDSSIVVKPDTPYDRQYKIDYVNIERESKSASNISTQIQAGSNGQVTIGAGGASGSSGGGGGDTTNNNSTAQLTSSTRNQFWRSLTQNVKALVGDNTPLIAGTNGGGPQLSAASPAAASPDASFVVANAETGLLVVRATGRQHERVQQYLDMMLRSAHRQVLIEATVAEVQLSDQYQQGINWQKLNSGSFKATQQPMGPAPLPGGSVPGSGPGGITYPPSTTPLPNPSLLVLQYVSAPGSFLGNVSAAVSLLESFGTVKVLSSPKLSVLNNQTAFLKVVDNRIYFTINVQVTPGTTVGTQPIVTYTSTPATVPVGFVMSVTPSIDETGMVSMDVRPTISRILDYVNDPNPALAQANVVSQIPEIQTREIESLLRVRSGDIAVMGGLMQDVINKSSDEVPFVGRIPWLGNLFKYRNDTHTKSELVIFLRPVVIRDASLDGDFHDYKSIAERDDVPSGLVSGKPPSIGTPMSSMP
jgi:MSHA biogenesis protein MshL